MLERRATMAALRPREELGKRGYSESAVELLRRAREEPDAHPLEDLEEHRAQVTYPRIALA